MRKPIVAVLVPAVLVASLGLTGCSSRNRWCEHDATDTRVSNKFCERNVSGYKWAYGSSHSRTHVKKHSILKHYKVKRIRKRRH